MTDEGDGNPKGPLRRHPVIVSAGIAAVGVIIVALIQFGLPPLLKANPESSPTPSASTPSPGPDSGQPVSPTNSPPVPGALAFLSELDPISETTPDKNSVNLSGTTFSDSLTLRVGGCRKSAEISYSLNGEWRRFKTTVGVTSDSKPGTEINFRLFVDDKQVGSEYHTTKFKSVPIDIDVSNALELRLRMTFVKGDMDLCSNAGYAAWGDAQLAK